MEEINIKDLFSYFISKFYLVFIIVFVFLFVGITYTLFFQTPKYSSNTTLVLTRVEDVETNTAITQTDIMLNQKLVSTYREIITSRSILKTVISDLELNYSINELASMVSVSSVRDTELIKISVSSTSATEATEIANALAVVFSERILDIFNIKNISIIDRAEIPSEPYNIRILLQIAIYLALGLFTSILSILTIYSLDTTLKDEEEVEKHLKLPVLGIVPNIKEKVR